MSDEQWAFVANYPVVLLSLENVRSMFVWPQAESPVPVLIELYKIMPDYMWSYYSDASLLDAKLAVKAVLASAVASTSECVDALLAYKATAEGRDDKLTRIGLQQVAGTGPQASGVLSHAHFFALGGPESRSAGVPLVPMDLEAPVTVYCAGLDPKEVKTTMSSGCAALCTAVGGLAAWRHASVER